MKAKLIALLTGVLLIAGSPNSFGATEIDGRYFADEYKEGNTNLKLTGVALFRYWGFKAYSGAFYLDEKLPVENVLANKAKRLELEYYRSIKGEDFGKAVNKILSKNLDDEALKLLKPRIDYHNSLYQDVKPGDRYSLTYFPGQGTRLDFNGHPVATIPGADFAEAIFSIWLGENPISQDFRQEILGKEL